MYDFVSICYIITRNVEAFVYPKLRVTTCMGNSGFRSIQNVGPKRAPSNLGASHHILKSIFLVLGIFLHHSPIATVPTMQDHGMK